MVPDVSRRLSAFPWIHPQTARGGQSFLGFRPGYAGSGMQRVRRPEVGAYSQRVTGIPLTGGQPSPGKISAQGTATVSVGPQALGTVWYPASLTLSTTSGTADSSTALVFLGAVGVPNLQVGQSYAAGADTVALAVPPLSPGQLLIVQWSGGNPGDACTVNVVGTMDALTM
jgi:hypothetical protein